MPQDDPDLFFAIDTENVTITHQFNYGMCQKIAEAGKIKLDPSW